MLLREGKMMKEKAALSRERGGEVLFFAALVAILSLCAYASYVSRTARPLGEILELDGERIVQVRVTIPPNSTNGSFFNLYTREREEIEVFLSRLGESRFSRVLSGNGVVTMFNNEVHYMLGLDREKGESVELDLTTAGRCYWEGREYRLKSDLAEWEEMLRMIDHWNGTKSG